MHLLWIHLHLLHFTSPLAVSRSGVYKSTDGGSCWNLRNNGIMAPSFYSLAIDPATPNTLYRGFGLLFSAVVTSTRLRMEQTIGRRSEFAATGDYRSLAIDPLNPIDSSMQRTQRRRVAVFKSTNAGATWQLLRFAVSFARSDRRQSALHRDWCTPTPIRAYSEVSMAVIAGP